MAKVRFQDCTYRVADHVLQIYAPDRPDPVLLTISLYWHDSAEAVWQGMIANEMAMEAVQEVARAYGDTFHTYWNGTYRKGQKMMQAALDARPKDELDPTPKSVAARLREMADEIEERER